MQNLSEKVMSFIAPADTAGEKKAGFGPTSLSFGFSILTVLSSEKAKTLPHTYIKKKKNQSYFKNFTK